MAPTLSEDWAAGCDLRLMPSVIEEGEMPAEGENLVVVGEFVVFAPVPRVRRGRQVRRRSFGVTPSGAHGVQAGARAAASSPRDDRSEKALVIAAVATFVNDYRETSRPASRRGRSGTPRSSPRPNVSNGFLVGRSSSRGPRSPT